MLAFYYGQAQKDSVWQTLSRTTSQKANQLDQSITKVSSKVDSSIATIQDIPVKYLKQVDKKIDKYSNRITNKTEKTLAKLSKWENKIKELLEKVSPETAAKLFAPGQMSFGLMLQKLQEGKAVVQNYKAQYDEYRDKLTTGLKYIATQKSQLENKYVKPVTGVTKKMDKLEGEIANSESVEKFIKERKKQLMDEAVKYIGKSKYLAKINKESYYYIETLRNYKEIFSDPKKAEQTALTILNKIPAFKAFTQKNSMLASLFGNSSADITTQSIAGLQTRAAINSLIQDRVAAGGPNAKEIISQNIQAAQAALSELKAKLPTGGSSADTEMPDFKPNEQKTKTFLQRLEYSANYQFGKANKLLPATIDIGLSLGYKLNNKSIVGLGASYKMGFGSIDHLNITHQGLALRSFVDWKLKKQFYISGGFEMNQQAGFKNVRELRNFDQWQQSGLIGISKKISLKTKLVKGTKFQLLFDFLYRQHVPVTQPVLFRIGYQF